MCTRKHTHTSRDLEHHLRPVVLRVAKVERGCILLAITRYLEPLSLICIRWLPLGFVPSIASLNPSLSEKSTLKSSILQNKSSIPSYQVALSTLTHSAHSLSLLPEHTNRTFLNTTETTSSLYHTPSSDLPHLLAFPASSCPAATLIANAMQPRLTLLLGLASGLAFAASSSSKYRICLRI